jgi:ATP synthase I chain
MGEEGEPLAQGTAAEVAIISHRGILINMAVVVAVGSIAGFAFFSWKAGVGVLVGGALGFANYFWQKHSLKAIFDRAIEGKKTRFLAARYILRYVVIAAALVLIYLTDTVSIYSVIFGLASFAIAVMLEGFRSLFSGSKGQET